MNKVKSDGLLGDLTHYWAAYNYNFVEPKMKDLAEAMDFNDDQIMVKLDSTVRYIENILLKFKDQLEELGCIQQEENLLNQKMVRTKLHDIQKLNVNFFMKAIDLAEQNRMSEFASLKEVFLKNILLSINELNTIFENYLAEIDEKLC